MASGWISTSPSEARVLVHDIDALTDALLDASTDGEALPAPRIDWFSIVPEHGERDEEGYAVLDVLDDVSLSFDDATPPTAAPTP